MMTTTTQQQIASNSAYWNKRTAAERKWIVENLKNDEAFNARIQEYFDKALTDIQRILIQSLPSMPHTATTAWPVHVKQ